MANITRIKNNQITDATIEYTKIKAGTLVGSVFNPNLTLNSNVTIVGNLSITGTPTTIQSTNTYVNDPLVVFNNGYSGTPSYDVGIIANRNLGSLAPYGSVNTAFVWSESEGAWIAVATTETGATTGSINNSGWANVKVGNLISLSSTVNGPLLVTGVTTLQAALNLTNGLTFTTATGGGLQVAAIGNVTPGTGAFTTGTFNSVATGGLQAVAIGNVTPGTGAFTTLSASSTLNVTGATTLTTATTGGLQVAAIGNVTPGTGAFTTGTFNSVATGGLQAVAIGNVTPGTAAFTTLSASGASTLNTVTGASFQGVIGNVTPNSGAFTTLTASGITTLTSGTDSTTALNGALVVTGGAGVSGNINAGGKVTVGSSEATTGVNTGAFQVPNGGAYIAGNLWVGGNINFTPNSVSTITGNSAQFFGNAAGFGALYAGISSGFVYQPQTVMQNSTSFNGYAQLNHQNINNGGDATSDYVATADNGTEDSYYIDMGIASSGYDNTTATNALGTSLFPNDGYLYAQGKAGFQGGNLTVGTSVPGTIVRMIAGGVDAANVIASVTNTGFKVNVATASTNTTTGALQVAGGAGIVGALNVGGALTVGGATNLASTTFTTATGGGLQTVAIGNVTPGTGAFTTLTAQTETVGGLQAVAIGNVTPGTAAFTTLSASGALSSTNTTQSTNTTTGAIVTAGGVGIAKNLNVGGDVIITGNLTVDGEVTTVNTATLDVEDLNITVAKGAASAAAANGAGLTVDGANATITYANADDSWNFNKLVNVNNTTQASNTTSGALIVDGGVGIAKNLYVGGLIQADTATFASINNTPIGNATPSTGSFTNLTAQTISTGGLQAVAIGNVTPGTAVFTSVTLAGPTGNISGVNYYIGSEVNAATIGNTGASLIGTVSTASQPNITSLGTLTGLSVSGATTLTTASVGGLQAVAIGNVTPGTGAFTTLTASSWANVTSTATSTSTTTGALKVAGGVGIAGNINVGDYNTSIHSLAGNVLIGRGPINPAAVASILTINENAEAPIGSQGLTVHLSGLSGKSASYGVDTFGAGHTSPFFGRHARGTSGSPSPVLTNDVLGGVYFKGYGTTGFSLATSSSPGIQVIAKEDFTDTAHGAGLSFLVTATGTTEAAAMMYLGTDGNLLIKSDTPSTSTSTGALTVVGGVGIAGNVNLGINLDVNGAITGNSSLQTVGRISNLDVTDTTAPGTGGIQTPGGGSFGGNVYVGKNIYIGPASFDTSLSVPTIIAVDNGTNYAQMAILNTAGSGSSDYAAYTANGNDLGGWADMGIAGNTFSDPNYTITKSQDGYFFTRPTDSSAGGNLVIATSEAGSHNDIVIGVGSFLANAEVARFHGNVSNNGTFVVKLPTNAVPAANTGAFQVWGGSSVSGNAYVGGALTVNGGKTANYDFYVKGKNDESLIWARPSASYDQVVIGGNATPAGLTGGAKLIVNSTDSILLPSGGSGDRPSSNGFTDIEGMFRYNTTLGAIEWFTGATWQTATTTFTIITDEQFNGDGSTTQFTLGGATTTAGTIVSINGVVQIPTLAYSITGAGNTTLEFTEAPSNGDIIDVRRLTTTQTLFGIASPNGKNAIQTDNNGVYIYTGLTGGSSTATTSWDGYGNEVSNRANVTVSSANTATTIVTMNATAYRSGKFVVQATHGTDYQVMEALVIHDGTTASVMSYGVVQTNGNLGVLSATYTSGNVLLQFVASNTSTIVRTKSDFLTI